MYNKSTLPFLCCAIVSGLVSACSSAGDEGDSSNLLRQDKIFFVQEDDAPRGTAPRVVYAQVLGARGPLTREVDGVDCPQTRDGRVWCALPEATNRGGDARTFPACPSFARIGPGFSCLVVFPVAPARYFLLPDMCGDEGTCTLAMLVARTEEETTLPSQPSPEQWHELTVRFVDGLAMIQQTEVPVPQTWEYGQKYWTDGTYPGVVYRMDTASVTIDALPAQFLLSSRFDPEVSDRRSRCAEDGLDQPASVGCRTIPAPPRPER